MNPYWGQDFGSFLIVFAGRLIRLLTGNLSFADLASDEIQIFVLALVGCASALVGTFLVLKKMTMLANSLSHTILLGIVLSYLILLPFGDGGGGQFHTLSLTTLLIASFVTAVLTTLLTQGLTHLMKIQEDASIGLVFTTLFAVGIVLVTVFTRNTHIGTEAIMGNVDALHFDDLKLISIIALADLILVSLFYKEFQMTAFDEGLAKSLGFSPSFFNYLLMVMTAATAIGAFRAVGVLLVLTFLVAPVLTARLFTDNLKKLIGLSIAIGFFCSFCAVALTRHLLTVYEMPLSTSGMVATLLGLAYFLSALFAPTRGLIAKRWFRRS